MASMDEQESRRGVQALEPWFQDMDLGGVRTAPEHFLYGYPETGSEAIDLVNRDYEFFAADHFNSPNYPKLHFIESACSGDPSNWWAPNAACSGAMLRSAGFEIRERPESEVYICRRSDCLDHVDAAGLSRWLPE